MTLTAPTYYAVRLLVALIQSDVSCSSDALVATAQVPASLGRKVLQQLKDAGLIAGRRGQHGGYRLTCVPERTTLAEVAAAVAPDPVLESRVLSELEQALTRELGHATEAALACWERVTLAELAR